MLYLKDQERTRGQTQANSRHRERVNAREGDLIIITKMTVQGITKNKIIIISKNNFERREI